MRDEGGKSGADTVVGIAGKNRKWKLLLWGALIGILILCLAVIAALTPTAMRSCWLPLAAGLADAKMEASDLRVESFFPLRIGVKDFHYSDWNGTVIDIKSASTAIHLTKLFKGTISLKNTYVSNMKLVVRTQPAASEAVSSVVSEETEPSTEPVLIMRHFKAETVTFMLTDSTNTVQQKWIVHRLKGDRFLPREKCTLEAEAEVKTHPHPKNPVNVNSLPFRMNAVYVMKDDYDLEAFHVNLSTGTMDLVLLNDYPIPAEVGVRLNLSADGKFLKDDTFQLQSAELFLFKEKQILGKLTLSGEIGKKFHCQGKIQDLNMEPILSFLANYKKAEMMVRLAEFHFEGRNFTEESLQSELTGEVKLKTEAMSFPVELDSKNRLFKLITIPLQALPSFFNLARLNLDFKQEVTACAESINAAVSGKKNLEFEKATADIALDRGVLNIRDIALHGKEIELESIRGTLDMPTGNLSIKSLIVFCKIKVPLNFEGTINNPSVNYLSAVRDFLVVNTEFLKTIKEDAASLIPKDTKLEKAVKRGLQDLEKFLKQ